MNSQPVKKLSPVMLASLQESIDLMLRIPQYSNYVRQHKLHLFDSNLSLLDRLLDSGELRDGINN